MVKKNDSLTSIANEHGVSLKTIFSLNDIEDPNQINVGQELRLPARNIKNVKLTPKSMKSPAQGKLTSVFGMRHGRMHYGIDIANKHGTPVIAPRAGFVTFSGWLKGYGQTIKIKSEEVVFLFAHLRERKVSSGEIVKMGQLIGEMGSTGNATGSHLHFEVLIAGEPVNPINYMNSPSDVLLTNKKISLKK